MAKSGIDYFPLDVNLDSKFELIEAEYGLTGFGVVVHLLQEIYGKSGYYIEWTNEVALLFAKKVGLGGGVVSEIVEASIRRGMFDKEIYDKYRVLTSKGIQQRYFEAVSRRKSLEVDFNILLVDAAQISKIADIKRKNVNILSKNADISEQSKVKKSRVKKSKVKKSKESANALSYSARTRDADAFAAFAVGDGDLLSVLKDFEKMRRSIKKPMTDRAKQLLVSKLKNDFPPEQWKPVLEQSIVKCWQDIYPLKEREQQRLGVEPHRENLSADEIENLKAIYAKVKGEAT